MSSIKEGDRVHVEFDADVLYGTDDAVELRVDGGAPGGPMWIRPALCTVIVPPIKVGDVVTADNIGQLRDGSVIAHPLSPAWTLDQSWWTRFAAPRAPGYEFCSGGYIVLRIGGGE